MSTDKQRIAFYADADIWNWYQSLPVMARSRLLNDSLRSIIAGADNSLEDRIARLEKAVASPRYGSVTPVETSAPQKVVSLDVVPSAAAGDGLPDSVKTFLATIETGTYLSSELFAQFTAKTAMSMTKAAFNAAVEGIGCERKSRRDGIYFEILNEKDGDLRRDTGGKVICDEADFDRLMPVWKKRYRDFDRARALMTFASIHNGEFSTIEELESAFVSWSNEASRRQQDVKAAQFLRFNSRAQAEAWVDDEFDMPAEQRESLTAFCVETSGTYTTYQEMLDAYIEQSTAGR